MTSDQRMRWVRCFCLSASLSILGCAVAPNYVIKGPPGPSPEASVAICEASIRREFTPHHLPEKVIPLPPEIVFLNCDLDSAGRASLIKRVMDLPVEFRPGEEQSGWATSTDKRAVSFSIRIKWIDDRSADVGVWLMDLRFLQGIGAHTDAKYESGQWRFYDSRHVSTIN